MRSGSTSGPGFFPDICLMILSSFSITSCCSVVTRSMISRSRTTLLICPCSSPSFPMSRKGTMRSLSPLSTSVWARRENILAHSQYCSAPNECLVAWWFHIPKSVHWPALGINGSSSHHIADGFSENLHHANLAIVRLQSTGSASNQKAKTLVKNLP